MGYQNCLIKFFNICFTSGKCGNLKKVSLNFSRPISIGTGVTRLGDLFIALWATFQSLWQQLFFPNHPQFKALVSFILLVKSFFGKFGDFSGHTDWYHGHHSHVTFSPISRVGQGSGNETSKPSPVRPDWAIFDISW